MTQLTIADVHNRMAPRWYSPEQRVLRRCILTETGCWIFTGATTPNGYGVAGTYNGRTQLTHRILFNGLRRAIPPGRDLHHTCGERLCCNPDHLEPVTRQEHARQHAEQRPPRTHCRRGHELTPENTYDYGHGRACRQCHLEKGRRRYARGRD